MKRKVTINIDQDVYEQAKKLGVNVSQACTNYLKTLNNQILATLNQNELSLTSVSFTKERECGRRDLNPGRQRGREIDWDAFREFVEKDHRPRVSRQLVSYALRFQDCLLTHDFSVIRDLDDTLRPNAMKGLSVLAKFLGCYDEFKQLIKNHDLKWKGKSADDIFIERLTNVEDPEEIWMWIRAVKKERPELTEFLDFMAVTGLRLIEAFNSYNLIIRLKAEGKLDSYYVADILEHFRFKEIFIRKSKKAFVSFVPQELVNSIATKQLFVSTDAIQKLIQKRGLQLRFADIREAHGTLMTKYLKKEEIDFLHGRVTSSVFMQHYFNPALISDLKMRVFQGIHEINEKIVVGGERF